MDQDRRTAYEALLRICGDGAYSNIELNRQITGRKPENPAFVRELTYGVLKTARSLDYYLAQLIQRNFSRLKLPVLTILRMGLYQFLYMDAVPDYAAVNEQVRLARAFCRGQAGFVNGVLRNFLRTKDALRAPGSTGSPAERLADRYSFDPWISQLWLDMFGEEEAASLMEASNRSPELCVRVNELKTSREELASALTERGFLCEASAVSPHVLKVRGSRLLEQDLFRTGAFMVQDEASAAAVDALDVQPGDRVLDVCAAPGGKSLAAAILAGDRCLVSAFDIHPHKLPLIEREAARPGVTSLRTGVRDASAPGSAPGELQDRIICDVPCSGLGVVRRKPEIKYKKIPDQGEALAELQYTILRETQAFLKPGGRLLYSTCTINSAENQDLVRRFLSESPAFRAVSERQFLPDRDGTDGFYYCILEKH